MVKSQKRENRTQRQESRSEKKAREEYAGRMRQNAALPKGFIRGAKAGARALIVCAKPRAFLFLVLAAVFFLAALPVFLN